MIPRDLAETINLREGDYVAFEKKGAGLLMKPKRVVDPDDTLTPEERVMIERARKEMREGKYVSLAQLEHELARQRPSRRRKTA